MATRTTSAPLPATPLKMSISRPPSLMALLLAVAVVAAVVLGVISLSDDPVRKKIENITSQVNFEGALHPFELIGFARSLASHISDPLTVYLVYQGEEHQRTVSRDDVQTKIIAARKELLQLATRIDSLVIVREDKHRARASMKVNAMGKSQGRADYFLEMFAVTAYLIQVNGDDWLIERLEVEDLRRE